ncbi:Armadillo repeat-containing protein 3 [Lamellibrachia satsuma]|nr:Armadillo repeat-containing protein 3 [Lamellibrachia satsuma]
MGKKVKKDDKGPPDDVFDLLMIESRNATTVILMLGSPEEDVLMRACDAIYRFIDKSDDNKKMMLDLDAVEPLLKLISHEEKSVRRYAIMALSLMAGHPDVRRMLRKREDTIPYVVALLSPDEDVVVHEYATYCLSHLANDFTSKIAIYEQGTLEALIRLLSSTDPDVQKNSIETITLMLQDYQTKAAIRDLNGIQPTLDLLKSEYPVIQQLALSALQLATQEADNRVALREMEGVNRLIDFIGRPEYNDLHVYAVTVLSNCLEDFETMEVIKENGGLQRLVSFIMDISPPEEDDKKGKKPVEKGASRTGKKGKGEDDDKRLKGDLSEMIVPTIPEVKEHASRALARAAKNADNRKLLHEQEVEKMLIFLLSHEDINVQVAAAHGIGVMALNMASCDSIGQWEGIDPLIKMLKSDSGDVREASAMALANLTANNTFNAGEIIRLHGVESLILLLADTRELVAAYAAVVLTNMTRDEYMRTEMNRCGVMTALIEPLKSVNTVLQSKAALAIAGFVCDAAARELLREHNGIEPLVKLLNSGTEDVRRSASWAITMAATDEPTAVEIGRYGGLDLLLEIQLSSTRKNAFTQLAIAKLLDNNLSAKYAITGHLGVSDLIADGFFDAGPLKEGAKFVALDDYGRQEINQKRPVILINAKPE